VNYILNLKNKFGSFNLLSYICISQSKKIKMNYPKMTKEEAINTINTSFPSIWSREDVLQLINRIDVPEQEKLEGFINKEKMLEKIRNAVENAINGMSNDEIVDISSCEFEIRNGNEIEIDSIGINTSDIADNIMADVEEAVDEYIEEITEVYGS
jgi:hypothetical protein